MSFRFRVDGCRLVGLSGCDGWAGAGRLAGVSGDGLASRELDRRHPGGLALPVEVVLDHFVGEGCGTGRAGGLRSKDYGHREVDGFSRGVVFVAFVGRLVGRSRSGVVLWRCGGLRRGVAEGGEAFFG
jgi:hypothetical protein